MKKDTFTLIENYMLSYMKDSAHDKEHIYRVLYNALEIASTITEVDYEILICACLLHDIGRKEQFENPDLCHAMIGGAKSHRFLVENGFDVIFANRVKQCIETHRYRKNNLPETIEAKILFDADKLDVSGAIGIARTLVYKGAVSEPLYSLLPNGEISNGENDITPSFFQEYNYKLKNLYTHFFTQKGKELANQRQQNAVMFYNNMYQEVSSSYENGINKLNSIIQ